ncbi:MAG: flagellar basal-body rod protein FlgF [Rhodomicrobium sp.]
MQSTLYIALSAQLALQDRLDTIAQNVANGTTAGYRASEVKFDSVLSNSGGAPVTFVSSGSQTIRRATGELVKTGNPLDVAVKGDGWLSVASPQGQTYTRDGRMQMNAAGSLVTLSGAPVLDAGGAPIQLDPFGGAPQIAQDGTISQGDRRAGVLGLFNLPSNATLSRAEGGVTSSVPGIPVSDFTANGTVQGFVEQSNVNPISEISRLVYVQRAFESVSAVVQSAEASFKNAIQTLGSSS